ncbi:MAG: DUF1287 domain-containing protein [Planctomycetaceae bacterium]|nr:DUF1287 domain-containing protein [Planctomycetaceae bacterium]
MKRKQSHIAMHALAMVCCGCLMAGCGRPDKPAGGTRPANVPPAGGARKAAASQAPSVPSPPVVAAARSQVGRTTIYDPAYVRLAYPLGDVPIDRGVCTDVVTRALRDGLGMDLQARVHEDMKASFASYPNTWGLSRPDPNIDHRRVPNVQRYFQRKGWALPVTSAAGDYLPGDIVTCTVPPNRPHIMIVSDRKNSRNIALVIHNIGSGAREEDGLFEFPLTGHYRVPAHYTKN